MIENEDNEVDRSAGGSTCLTTRSLAERWDISMRSLERWRSEGYGPAWIVIGGSVRYRLCDVEAYEARHRREP